MSSGAGLTPCSDSDGRSPGATAARSRSGAGGRSRRRVRRGLRAELRRSGVGLIRGNENIAVLRHADAVDLATGRATRLVRRELLGKSRIVPAGLAVGTEPDPFHLRLGRRWRITGHATAQCQRRACDGGNSLDQILPSEDAVNQKCSNYRAKRRHASRKCCAFHTVACPRNRQVAPNGPGTEGLLSPGRSPSYSADASFPTTRLSILDRSGFCSRPKDLRAAVLTISAA